MSDFIAALQEKIDEIEEAREAAVQEFDTKLELLRELMESEGETPTSKAKAPTKRRSGRPKGSKNKKNAPSKHAVEDDLYKEAMQNVEKLADGGTSAELQASRTKSFNPAPRPLAPKAPNVHAGTREAVNEARMGKGKADAIVSVDESDLEDD
jgi:hypothetical protein